MDRLVAVLRCRLQILLGLAAFAAVLGSLTNAGAVAAPRLPGTPVPAGFVGVNAGGPLFGTAGIDPAAQFDTMVASGVQSIRVVFDWSAAQPYKSWSDVPAAQRPNFVDAAGVPTDFRSTDQVVALASQRGLRLLPTVLLAPSWDAGTNPMGLLPPLRPRPVRRLPHRADRTLRAQRQLLADPPPKLPVPELADLE